MKTKPIFFGIALFTATAGGYRAQPPDDLSGKREMIELHKIAFITRELNLTPEEAQAFWPVYNQCHEKAEELRKSNRQKFKDNRMQLDQMSDKEVEALVDNEIAVRQSELDLDKECHVKYKQVLPVRKVAKLYRAETEFKRILLKKIQERREPHQWQSHEEQR